MGSREAIEARKEALQRELDKREASLSTSELQARYVTGRGRSEDVAEDRDVEREPAWGEAAGGRRERAGDWASRRQAARVTRGASSRGGDE